MERFNYSYLNEHSNVYLSTSYSHPKGEIMQRRFEMALDEYYGFDHVVKNNGSLEDFLEYSKRFVEQRFA